MANSSLFTGTWLPVSSYQIVFIVHIGKQLLLVQHPMFILLQFHGKKLWQMYEAFAPIVTNSGASTFLVGVVLHNQAVEHNLA